MSYEKDKTPITKKLVLIFMILALIMSCFAIYELSILGNIENLIRYSVIAAMFAIDIFITIKSINIFKKRSKHRHSKRIGFIIFLILYSLICFGIGGAIFYIYGKVNNINKESVIYSSSLVMMANDDNKNIKDIKDVKDFIIGTLDDTNKKSPDGYIIPQEIIKDNLLNDDNEIKNYSDYSTMLTDLYLGDIDAMIVPTDYPSLFSEIDQYKNIATETKIIVTKEKKLKKADTSKIETASNGKDITEPFTILLMGIDSTDEVLSKNAVANGDTLILITFNPKNLNATMLSIPRDSYLPIACWPGKAENKITHAAAYGNDCMINTIQNYLDVNIDYYAKINFKGLVKLVDALGGVDINVEQTLCTDDSSRGSEICVNPGFQTLDGEHALVYARNRHALVNGDFGRNQHQQEIIIALTDKIKGIDSVGQFMNILDTISNSLDTNLTTQQMLSFYNVAKDIVKRSLSSEEANIINIEQLYLAGNSQMIYDERMRMMLYNYIPNKNSRNDIVKAMKQNLELVPYDNIKEFSFSINEPYEKKVIGQGPYNSGGTYSLLPNFIGDTEAQARATASKLGIKIAFEGTDGRVVSQSYPAGKRIDLISGTLVLTLSNGKDDKDKNDSKLDSNDKTDKDKEKEKVDDNTNKDNDNKTDNNTEKTDNKKDENPVISNDPVEQPDE